MVDGWFMFLSFSNTDIVLLRAIDLSQTWINLLRRNTISVCGSDQGSRVYSLHSSTFQFFIHYRSQSSQSAYLDLPPPQSKNVVWIKSVTTETTAGWSNAFRLRQSQSLPTKRNEVAECWFAVPDAYGYVTLCSYIIQWKRLWMCIVWSLRISVLNCGWGWYDYVWATIIECYTVVKMLFYWW